MAKIKLEYLWLDGYQPVANVRSKTKIIDGDVAQLKLEDLPVWGFDGSSTQQAEGKSSDCLLKPAALFRDPTRRDAFLVMAEVLLPNGQPHPTNTRATIPDDPDSWFGFEQEYFFFQDGRPLGFPNDGFPAPQGTYYTGVGYRNVGSIARQMVDEHIDICVDAGINIEGINAEVAKGQWEFQIFGKGSKNAADQMWVARYILMRLSEKHGVDIEWHCKPLRGAYNAPLDWNGSGMHSNFSTKHMREVGGKAYFEKLMEAFSKRMDEHIAVYGPDNHYRLTGLHETQAIDKFSYGLADRGASVRVPHSFINNGYRGYLEDRRPNSAADPYLVAGRILKTVQSVPTS
jgi:glutamine synthetase